jgi:F-type H+-transporting ATPase subunit a
MHHITTNIFGHTVHADSLYFAWGCMALILLSAVFLISGLNSDPNKYGFRQYIAESIYGFIRWLVRNQVGAKHGDKYIFFVGSIFIFILINYYAGLLPWKMGHLFSWWPHGWHGASPCADINITAGMAVLVILVYLLSGVFIGGFAYIQMFLPINFSRKGISLNLMCLIELMDLIVRPLTLSLRLFANTVAGETLLITFVTLAALLVPVGILGFELFVGLLQAFLFAILSSVYIGAAVQHAEHLVHDKHHH